MRRTPFQELTVEPAAPGLDLIRRGIREASPSEEVALERGEMVYDALFAQLAHESGEPREGGRG